MTNPVRILALGEFLMFGSAGRMDVTLSHVARSLLVHLARERRPALRDELAARWWPDVEPQRARASLSTAVWTVRSALRDGLGIDPLDTSHGRVALASDFAVDVDVERFENAIARDDDIEAERWYGGPFLAGNFEDDVVAERERLATLYERVLTRLLARDPDPERARRLVAADPYAEIAYRVLVDDALADGSNTSAARSWLRRARSAFAEIDAMPVFFEEPKYRRLLDVDSERAPRTNLGSEVTSFVGRADECATLAAAFEETRVVTILGSGGCGKTRLAREFANRTLGRSHRPAWFVELAAAEGDGAVLSAIATVVGLRDDRRSRETIVFETLRDSDALLVLDNCEHLVEQAATVVARLSRESPLLQILTTSREALAIEAEAIVPLAGLPGDDATSLFIARARASDRRLIVDDSALEYARRIGEALDGLPLAIELAAGRVRIDGLEAIAEDALRVVHLAVGPRDRARRTRTIESSIAWSVERLDASARLLFGRLGSFAGSFDAEDCAALDLDQSDALELLIGRSLVVRDDPFGVMMRLLSPLREDARRRLESDPRREEVRDAHAARTLANVHTAIGLRGGDAGSRAEKRLDELATDIDLALERSFARGRSIEAIDAIVELASHWAARAERDVARRWLARGDAVVRDDLHRGHLALARVRSAHDLEDNHEMIRLGRIAQEAFAVAGAAFFEGSAWNVVGCGYLGLQRNDEAQSALERSLELKRLVADDYGIAIALTNLAVIAVEANDLTGALAAFEESAVIFDRLSTIQARVKTYNNIAFVRMMLGDEAASDRASARAIALAESGGNGPLLAFAFANAACRLLMRKSYELADEHARRVGEIADGPPVYIGYALIARAGAAFAAGDAPRARRFASAARVVERDFAPFEATESGLLAELPGSIDEAVDRDPAEFLALLRKRVA